MGYFRQLLQWVMAFDKWNLLVTTLSATTHQYVKIPTPAMSGGGGITIAFWFKRVAAPFNQAGYRYLLDARSQTGGTGDTGSYLSLTETGPGWTFWVNGVSSATFPYNAADWTYVQCVRAGKNWNAGEITLGCRFNNVEAIGGAMFYDIRVYNRALTTAEMTTNYLTPPTSGMTRRYEFKADTNTIAYDTSGNAGNAAKFNY